MDINTFPQTDYFHFLKALLFDSKWIKKCIFCSEDISSKICGTRFFFFFFLMQDQITTFKLQRTCVAFGYKEVKTSGDMNF